MLVVKFSLDSAPSENLDLAILAKSITVYIVFIVFINLCQANEGPLKHSFYIMTGGLWTREMGHREISRGGRLSACL
jgi:hypothetical protein